MTWDSSKVKTQERVEAARDSSRYLKEDQGKELCEKKSEDGHSDESPGPWAASHPSVLYSLR